MVIILSFMCGIIFMLWLSAMFKVMEMDRQLKEVKSDIIGMGDTFQKCLNDVCDQINSHAEVINRHQSAINYLTKDSSDD